MSSVGETIGLIAGNGQFPRLFARGAKAAGARVIAVAHEGESLTGLEPLVDHLTWIKIGQLDTLIDTFHAHGVRRAVMAGGIDKASLMAGFAPDERGLRLLARISEWGDDVLLRELAAELQSEGIEVAESTLYMESVLAPRGVLTAGQPSEEQWRDIRFGFDVLRGIGAYDIGQSVVVKSAMVMAVEAIEGTDAALRRGGDLARGGAVAIKASKPGQDLRFDVPAVGLATVNVCVEAAVAVLAVEAGKTLIFDREDVIATADEHGLVVVGVGAGDEAGR